MGISSLNTSTPGGGESAGGGNEHLQEIKTEVRASFTGFTSPATDVCTSTGPQLDAAASRAANYGYGSLRQSGVNYTQAMTSSFAALAATYAAGPYAGNVAVSTSAVTVNASGDYKVTVSGRVSAGVSAGGYQILVGVSKNASLTPMVGLTAGCQLANSTVAACGGGFSASCIATLAAADALTLLARNVAGSIASGDLLFNDLVLTVERA